MRTDPSASRSQRYIQIDEDGYFMMEGLRVADADAGRDWLAKLKMDDRGRIFSRVGDEDVLVEAFDEPFIALDVSKSDAGKWQITMPYGHTDAFSPETLSLDEWDRFHGRTDKGIPFTFSRSAQSRFFNLLDEFEDDAIVIDGKRFEMQPWLRENPDANDKNWWTEIYRTEEPRWELGAPHPSLANLVPQLKLSRQRVLVLGAGTGNDASFFAQLGHIVTAVDFSEEAISRAKSKYGHLPNLSFVQADVFNLPSSMNSSFDLVFEHTLYCAINPSRRTELMKIWRRLLTENGHLMGIFFTMDKLVGPPYGGSEWEIRSRLQKSFRPLYWTRLRDSRENRLGHELFVYAQRLSTF